MPQKSTIKLPLTPAEKTRLRQRKIRIGDLLEFAVDEIAGILEVPMTRARELRALAEFQEIPSVGIKFAEDLVFLGYYSVRELAEKDGATLIEEFELKKGYWLDPCVEDQFRLVAHVAKHHDHSKQWWHFTPVRKAYRAAHGYPASRPTRAWHEVPAENR